MNGSESGSDSGSAIDRSPTRLSASVALLAGTLSLGATTLSATLGAGPAALGLVGLGVGAFQGSRRAISLGTAGLVLGVLVAGSRGAPAEPMLVGAVAAVVAWDAGHNGVSLGEQLGRQADTGRAELVHSTASVVVGALTVGVGYGAFLSAAEGEPVTALVFLLLGVVALASALRR